MPVRHLLSKRVQEQLSGGASGAWDEFVSLAKSKPNVIDLGQGAPDFLGSEPSGKVESSLPSTVLRKIAQEAISGKGQYTPKTNQYSPTSGLPKLQKSISEFHSRVHGSTYDPETEVVVTASASEALFSTCLALLEEGDELLNARVHASLGLHHSCDSTLVHRDIHAGPLRKLSNLQPPHFSLPAREVVEAAFSKKTKMVFWNTPHNPTGHIFSREEAELMAELCIKYDCECVADEVYENTCWGARNVRISTLPGMADRTVSVGSASKMFNVTGWRVGWAVGPSDLVSAINCIHSHITFCAPTPLQEAVAQALDQEDGTFSLTLAAALSDIGVQPLMPHGGYFLVADISSLGKSDVEFCKWLIQEKGVLCMPMCVFYSP
eukprot:gene2460-3225_t